MTEPSPRSDRWARFVAHAVPVLPLFVVTGFAGYGQVLFGLTAYSPVDWPWQQRLGVAIGVAVGIESIGLFVQWHAHDALLMKATSTAARLRRASYLIAGGVAAINYSHFAGPQWSPTPGALVFAAFSAAGPWLWGLHTRRAQRVQLTREGQIDATGATFSAERWRAFPWRTWAARRWSIDNSVNDPRAAWEGYRAARKELVGVAGIEPAPASPPAELPNRASTAEVPTAPHPEPPTVDDEPAVEQPNSVATPPRGIHLVKQPTTPPSHDLVEQLLAEGAGRRRIAKETGLTENQARLLIKRRDQQLETADA